MFFNFNVEKKTKNKPLVSTLSVKPSRSIARKNHRRLIVKTELSPTIRDFSREKRQVLRVYRSSNKN